MSVFLDTWGFKAFIDSKEEKHFKVVEFLGNLWKKRGKVVTSDYIIDETITLLATKLPFDKLKVFIEQLDKSVETGFIELHWISSEDFEKAKALRMRFHDKPRISFTDLTTMVVMEKNRITDIVTSDKHFNIVGKGFKTLF